MFLNFSRNKLALKFLGLLCVILLFGIGNLFLTTKISQSYRFAVSEIYKSNDVDSHFGAPRWVILYTTGFEGVGSYSCSTFGFIVSGIKDSGFVQVQVRQESKKAPFIVTELIMSLRPEFKKGCKDRTISGVTP